MTHVFFPVESDVFEGHAHELFHGVRFAGRNHVIVRFILLQHVPHRLHVVAGEAPVALRVQIAHAQFFFQTQLDARHAVGDFARYEFFTATRGSRD